MLNIDLWNKIISQLFSMWKHFFIEGVWFWSSGCRHACIIKFVSWHIQYHPRKCCLGDLVWGTGRFNMLMTWRQWSTTLLFQMSLLCYFHFCWHLLHVTKCILPIQQLIKQVSVCSGIKLEYCYRVISSQIIIILLSISMNPFIHAVHVLQLFNLILVKQQCNESHPPTKCSHLWDVKL